MITGDPETKPANLHLKMDKLGILSRFLLDLGLFSGANLLLVSGGVSPKENLHVFFSGDVKFLPYQELKNPTNQPTIG